MSKRNLDQGYFERLLEMNNKFYESMLKRSELIRKSFEIFLDFTQKHFGRIENFNIYAEYEFKDEYLNEDKTLNKSRFAFEAKSYELKDNNKILIQYPIRSLVKDYLSFEEWSIIFDIVYGNLTLDQFLSDKEDKGKWIDELILFYHQYKEYGDYKDVVSYAKNKGIKFNEYLAI